jgi:hypothetical protein
MVVSLAQFLFFSYLPTNNPQGGGRGTSNSKPPGPIIVMMGQSETLSTSLGQIYYTLFYAGAQRLSPATARCTNMLSQNQFPEPNRHVVDFLHQFSAGDAL